ncbi:CGNR zinc finger domain-containing protein, partial [Mycolicibacterium sp.]
PWLTRHVENPDWHLHLGAADDPLSQRMGAEIAMALADLIRGGELRRLKVCAAPDCTAVLTDLSRNRSKIFCDTGNCGNRQHVAAYRQRQREE